MKAHVAALTLILAVLGPAAENSPFYLPIRNNGLTTLKKLIDSPGPKARDGRGNSPLMYSAAVGSLESMRLLLDAGADPNAANDFAATPLMWCAVAAAKPLGIPAGYDVEGREARATASLRGAIEQQLFQVQDPPPGVDSQEISLMQMAAAGVPPTLATDAMLHALQTAGGWRLGPDRQSAFRCLRHRRSAMGAARVRDASH